MKIRTDFVTNSSSSNYVVEITIIDKNDKEYTYTDNPTDYDPDAGGNSNFIYSLRDLKSEQDNMQCTIKATKKTFELINNLHVGIMLELKKNKYIDVLYNGTLLGHLKDDKYNRVYSKYEKGTCKCFVSYVDRVSEEEFLNYGDKPSFYVDFLVEPESESNRTIESIFGAKTVKELCRLLVDNVKNDSDISFGVESDDYDEENDDEYDEDNEFLEDYKEYKKNYERQKDDFVEKVSKNVKRLSDIKTIEFNRFYSAWGEFAELVGDNDYELVDYAKRLLKSTGAEKEEVEKEMLEYIRNANVSKYLDSFGTGFRTVKYSWNPLNDLEELAERLCSNYASETAEGIEHSDYDVATGTIQEEAEITLQ